jgi:uncharacterized protein
MPWFLLLGYDDPGFVDPEDQSAEDELNEAHWSYMDLVADRLLARGPMLTPNHDGHVGSIHVLNAENHREAEMFAFNEPYYLAGLYERVEVIGFEPWIDESMWERPGDAHAGCSWLVMWRGDSRTVLSPPLGRPEIPDSVLCAGWMFDSAGASLFGAAALFDAPADDPFQVVNMIEAQLATDEWEHTLIPWRRGGRLA